MLTLRKCSEGNLDVNVTNVYWKGRGYNPFMALWGELLAQTVKDCHSKDKVIAQEAREFLFSNDEDFLYILSAMDLDSEMVIDKIRNNIDNNYKKLILWFRGLGDD